MGTFIKWKSLIYSEMYTYIDTLYKSIFKMAKNNIFQREN